MLSAPMSRFRQLVFADPALHAALRAPLDDAAFIALAIDAAAARGIELTAADLRALLDAGHREWVERWL